MAFFNQLAKVQQSKKTHLCVGLDPQMDRLPEGFSQNAGDTLSFLKQIIDATAPYACAFKPQSAYFSAYGLEKELEQLIAYIKKSTDCAVIFDGKRNDIGSTAEMYAREAFIRYSADAVTVNPYMGEDTITPFVQDSNRGVFVLCRTSNAGARTFQNLITENQRPLYRDVAHRALENWNQNHNVGLVIGATAPEELWEVRKNFPKAWFLVPGVGAQGGDLNAVLQAHHSRENSGLIINSSRSILYAAGGKNWLEAAEKAALNMQKIMAQSFS